VSQAEDKFHDPGFPEMLRARDRGAIEAVVRAYTSHLYNACAGMGFDNESAKEMVQETWVVFFEKAPTFEGRSSIRTYLFGILYNKVREHRRKREYQDFDEMAENQFNAQFDARGRWLAPPIGPEEFVLAIEIESVLERCMEALPPTHRLAFALKEVEDCSSEEICNAMGVTRTNLGAILSRARSRLRGCVEKKGIGKKAAGT